MGILLAFAPFVVFAIIDRLLDPAAGLVAGAATSLLLLARALITPGRTPKILELGTLILFGGLSAYVLAGHAAWSVIGVRLRVDGGLLVIVLISMAIGRPFTLQYARENVAPAFWDSPEFMRTNYIITAGWAVAFALMVVAELALLYVPALPHRLGVITIIAALIGAVKFTSWYPQHLERQRV
jgi:hypothetical protein